jgi:hypothetical protein
MVIVARRIVSGVAGFGEGALMAETARAVRSPFQ